MGINSTVFCQFRERRCWLNITLCFVKHNNTLLKRDFLIPINAQIMSLRYPMTTLLPVLRPRLPRSWAAQRPDNVAYSVWVFVPHTEGTSLLLVLLVPNIPCTLPLPPAFPGFAFSPGEFSSSNEGAPHSGLWATVLGFMIPQDLHSMRFSFAIPCCWNREPRNPEISQNFKKIFRRVVFSYIYRYFLRPPWGGRKLENIRPWCF